MKLLSKAFFVGALGLMAAASQAQGIIFGGWYPISVNYVTNPGFESLMSDWNGSNSYFEGDELMFESLCSATMDPHSGHYGLDMYQGDAYGYNGFYHAEVIQTLTTPVAVSSLWQGSVWCQSGGNILNMVVTYTDNTATYASFSVDSQNAAPGNNGYVQWNFLPLLNQSKTIKAIDFSTNSFDGTNIEIDDVSLSTLVWIYI